MEMQTRQNVVRTPETYTIKRGGLLSHGAALLRSEEITERCLAAGQHDWLAIIVLDLQAFVPCTRSLVLDALGVCRGGLPKSTVGRAAELLGLEV